MKPAVKALQLGPNQLLFHYSTDESLRHISSCGQSPQIGATGPAKLGTVCGGFRCGKRKPPQTVLRDSDRPQLADERAVATAPRRLTPLARPGGERFGK
eukprot:COSAG02_NODE_8920_length_2400_cov_1.365928_6_plen_99_part_00